MSDAPKEFTITLDDAVLINNAFLPLNPNKCRSAHPDVVDAVRRFKAALRAAVSRGEGRAR